LQICKKSGNPRYFSRIAKKSETRVFTSSLVISQKIAELQKSEKLGSFGEIGRTAKNPKTQALQNSGRKYRFFRIQKKRFGAALQKRSFAKGIESGS
jgi:hypothetical protein